MITTSCQQGSCVRSGAGSAALNCIAFSAADGRVWRIGLDAVEIPTAIIYALVRIGDKKA
jgi:hypothetical protein